MIKLILQIVFRFVFLILLQVWVINNIQLGGFINPYIYILFVLLLPFTTPGWVTILLSFFLGLTIDMFADTLGMHASATVFMGFMRQFVLGSISSREGYEKGTLPRISDYGFIWFFKYSLLLIFLHHLFLFTIEVFNFSTFHLVLVRTILSTLLSSILILLSQYIIFKK